jgi:hypothetical protein
MVRTWLPLYSIYRTYLIDTSCSRSFFICFCPLWVDAFLLHPTHTLTAHGSQMNTFFTPCWAASLPSHSLLGLITCAGCYVDALLGSSGLWLSMSCYHGLASWGYPHLTPSSVFQVRLPWLLPDIHLTHPANLCCHVPTSWRCLPCSFPLNGF